MFLLSSYIERILPLRATSENTCEAGLKSRGLAGHTKGAAQLMR
jgi:hypothetical protein